MSTTMQDGGSRSIGRPQFVFWRGVAWGLVLSAFMLGLASLEAAEVAIEVDVDAPQAELSPVLYGLFYEDINYSADGGLYAELVQNRSFEYYGVTGWAADSQRLNPLTAWQKVEREGGRASLEVVDKEPLNSQNTKYLQIELGGSGPAGVSNVGYAGIPVSRSATYDFSVYARRSGSLDAPLWVSLETPTGEVLATGTIQGLGDSWQKYEVALTATADCPTARLVLTTRGEGTLMLDMVSLFPRETFKGRKNGLRPDLAQALADLKPGFLRFPGGCIAHGHGLANAYRWKDTVGDVAERKPNWNLWGYHQTYGLGYFEYMQFCEDIGATPLPVVPLGISCGFRQPFENAPLDELSEWIEDALDLIEFANGPVDSAWGKVRAEMGHPEPFGLEYVCLGNEEHDTPEMRERFPLFVEAIRSRYPEIKIVGTSGLGPEIPLFDLMARTKVYSTDEHYYLPPSWYLANTDRFTRFDRNGPKIFVGEYASEGNTQLNAVAEAAYLTGIERNADVVDMTCYAPLLARIGSTQWTKANLIWFTDTEVVKTPNYYVQQLFSLNKGDVYLENQVTMRHDEATVKSFAGRVGVGTWRTTIEVEQVEVNGTPVEFTQWQVDSGDFAQSNGLYTQRDVRAEGAVSVAPQDATGSTATYSVRARKTGGAEGFLVVFGYQNDQDYYWWNVGGWNNSQHALQRQGGGSSQDLLISTPGSIESNRWYDLKVELSPGRIRCYIDEQLVHDYRHQEADVSVSPTLDRSTGELALKMVNPGNAEVKATIKLRNAKALGSAANLTVLAGPPDAVNRAGAQPIVPHQSSLPASETMQIVLPPTSVQVLRVKVQP
jgi:alpha-L-arabinofuranosidase